MKSSFFKNLISAAGLSLVASSPMSFADEVELKSSFSVSMSAYGFSWSTHSFSVLVENISSEKDVFIHREKDDGTWVDIPMYFDRPAGGGKEVWSYSDTSTGWGDEFAVKMVVDGVEYWDNNFGYNYTRLSQGYMIGNSQEIFVSSYSESDAVTPGYTRVGANLVLDNLGPVKDVTLVYSTDGWYSSDTIPANFAGNRPIIGYGSYPNPSENGAELWTVSFEVPADVQGEFYVKYSVDGVNYFDSNGGDNFSFNTINTINESMHVRFGPHWQQGMPMYPIADNLWATNIQISETSGVEMKFDVFNDWSVNFGDNDYDGIAEFDGANILLPTALGQYRVFFNDEDLTYTFQPFGIVQ